MLILEFKLFSLLCGNTTIYMLSSPVIWLLQPQSRHKAVSSANRKTT